MSAAVTAIGVVVPVHDEVERLGDCLAALAEASARVDCAVRVVTVVVLDDCTDGSEAVARAWSACAAGDERIVLCRQLRNVGRARGAGMDALLERLADRPAEKTWLATTDADSRVPGSWLTEQLRLASQGVEAVAGSIQVSDWSEHPSGFGDRFRQLYEPNDAGSSDDTHEHVHGANLGVRADAYLAVGGFAPLETGEDHALWRALGRARRRQLSSRRLAVVTSARLSARAPAGFSSFLAQMSLPASPLSGAS
jgi:GT2 family glycosyltransferase